MFHLEKGLALAAVVEGDSVVVVLDPVVLKGLLKLGLVTDTWNLLGLKVSGSSVVAGCILMGVSLAGRMGASGFSSLIG